MRLGAVPDVRLVCALAHIDHSIPVRGGRGQRWYAPLGRKAGRLYPRPPRGVNEPTLPASDIPAPKCTPSGRITIPGAIEAFPEALAKLRRKMWILWKTQDLSVPSLWITPLARLLLVRSSGRIGDALTTRHGALRTLKTPVQTVCRRSRLLDAPAPHPAVIHSVPGWTGASSSLIHRTTHGTLPERRVEARYTLHLVFRLLWELDRIGSFPHMWKGLWNTETNRRSVAIRGLCDDRRGFRGYAPEQVFWWGLLERYLWTAVSGAARGGRPDRKRETILRCGPIRTYRYGGASR